MIVRKVWMAVLAAVSVSAAGSAQDLYHLDFSGTAQALVNGTLTSRRITQWDLIARCAGEEGLRTNNLGTNQQFDLVYNPSADSVQVIRLADGSAVCDVFQFQGGITNDDGGKNARLAYVFTPEETQSVGTVILRGKDKNRRNRLSLHGQIQFVLANLTVGGEGNLTNSTNAANTIVSSPVMTSNSITAQASSITLVPPPLPGTTGSVVDTNSITTVNTNSTAISTTNSAAPPDLALPGSTVVSTNSSLPNLVSTNTTTVVTTNSSVPPELALPGSTTVVSTNSTLPNLVSTNTTGVSNPSLAIPPNLGLALSTATNTSLSGLGATNSTSLVSTNAATNEVVGLSFTNGVICNASFTANRRIHVPVTP